MLVDPPHADDVGALTEPQQLVALPARTLGVADAETQHDLRALRHRVHALDEGTFRRRVETEGVRAPEGAAEHRQVERRLVMGGRMEHGRHPDPADGRHRGVVEVRGEGNDVGVRRAHGVHQLGRDRAVVLDPPFRLLGCRHPRSQPYRPVQAVEVGEPAVRGRVPVHGHAVELGRPRIEDVVPRDGVERAGRVDLGFPVRVGLQVLGQLARRRLRPTHHLGPVARRDEDHLLAHGRFTTVAIASTIWAAAWSPDSSAARRRPAAVSTARKRSSVQARWTAAAT